MARKAENARLLAEEEASASSKAKAAKKPGPAKKKTDNKPAGPGALAAGGGLGGSKPGDGTEQEERKIVEEFSATGIDDALALMEIVTAKTDKASVGQQAAKIETHPEVNDHWTSLCITVHRKFYYSLFELSASFQGANSLI